MDRYEEDEEDENLRNLQTRGDNLTKVIRPGCYLQQKWTRSSRTEAEKTHALPMTSMQHAADVKRSR